MQQGFDEGFAQVGVPLGRELGILRGLCSALLAVLGRAQPHSSQLPSHGFAESGALLAEVRDIAARLADVRLSDIASLDPEAVAHAREHLADAAMSVDNPNDEDDDEDVDPAALNEEIRDKRDMEGLEDLMARMGAGAGPAPAPRARPTAEDVARLRDRLMAVAQSLGLALQWS